MFRNTLFLKIILVFTLPALGMMYFSTVLVYEKIQTLSEVSSIQKNIEYLKQTKDLIDAIEEERSASINFQLSKKDKGTLDKKRVLSNLEYTQFIEKTSQVIINNKSLIVNIKTIQELFYNLNVLRERIEQSKLTNYEILDEYNKINNFLISSLTSIKPINFATEFNRKLLYIIDLITLKEYSNIEGILTKLLFKKNAITNKMNTILLENYTIQDIHLKKFLLNGNIKEINTYSEVISLSLLNAIQTVRASIRNRDLAKIDSEKAFLEKTVALEKVYDFVFIQLKKMATKIENKAQVEQILSLSFLFVSFVTLISLLFVLKNIIFNEQKSYNKVNKQQEVYKLLHAVNMFLLTINDEKKLYKEICKLISLNPNMAFGFVYKVDKNGTTLIAQEGGLKDILDIKLQEKENRDNLISKAIKAKKNIIVDSFEKDHRSILTDVAKEYKLKSAAALPIKRFDKIAAVLVLYSNELNFFDNEIEILFNNMINDMTHSLEKIIYEKERLEQEHELKIASYAFESNEPMIITDRSAHIIKANRAFCTVMGYEKEEIIGRNPSIFRSENHGKDFYHNLWKDIVQNGSWSGEIYNTMKNKEKIPLRSTITAIKNSKGVATHYLAQYIDISEQLDKQKILEYQATHDNLTGLPNRLLLLDRIERALTKVERHNTVGGLIFIDLDNFKEVNDTLGHEIGDKLLIMVAKKINETIRKEDTIARIGGDEFIILADHIADSKDNAKQNMSHLAKKIKFALNSIIEIDGHKNISTPSIGVTLFCDSSVCIQDLIKQADTAMYQAKRQGKNAIAFFD